MKTTALAALLLSVLLVSACGSATSTGPVGEDYKIRAATPGVVDHNVIPKKSKK